MSPPDHVFNIILDVEKYHEFLPWCIASKIAHRYDDHFFADLVIRFKIFTQTYRSKVLYEIRSDGSYFIRSEAINGPFEYLINEWSISPLENGTVEVEFMINFKFKSNILNIAIAHMFSDATQQMINAFEKRIYTQKYT
jgi:coenzyme Q-binding protein COQ10